MAPRNRAYRIRSYVNGRSKDGTTEYTNYSLTVPSEIAESLPEEIQFVCRMTEEGLLYEPVSDTSVELPEWAKTHNENNVHAKQLT